MTADGFSTTSSAGNKNRLSLLFAMSYVIFCHLLQKSICCQGFRGRGVKKGSICCQRKTGKALLVNTLQHLLSYLYGACFLCCAPHIGESLTADGWKTV